MLFALLSDGLLRLHQFPLDSRRKAVGLFRWSEAGNDLSVPVDQELCKVPLNAPGFLLLQIYI